VQASTETINTDQRTFLKNEATALADQIDKTITDTKWNGIALLNAATTATIKIQIGDVHDQTLTITTTDLANAKSGVILAEASDMSSQAKASAALAKVDTAQGLVNTARAALGAVSNRLTSIVDNLTNVAQNLVESRSRIMDTDYAAATTELARTQIIQQAGTAVLAQANQQSQSVLALLRS